MAKFSFKEMIKGIKKRKGDEAEESISLGTFPASVHKLWASRHRGWSQNSIADSSKLGNKIAICLTVVDNLPHEGLWQKWLNSSKLDPKGRSGSMYIHAKFPDKVKAQQPWAGERTLAHSYVPEWNDVKVVRAMLSLIREALKDKETAFIYLGTESCVPITSFTTVADRLYSEGAVSWLNEWPENPPTGSGLKRASKFEASSQFAVVDPQMIPTSAVWKALPGWITLTRHHAEAIVNLEEKSFFKHFLNPPSLLSKLLVIGLVGLVVSCGLPSPKSLPLKSSTSQRLSVSLGYQHCQTVASQNLRSHYIHPHPPILTFGVSRY
mmetsp:Transcript_2845/g.3497  ORF Transcript_2845/g.3497 Transcript_2845/m.3497 type:complete len:323 (-) Transcript_2845:283-1251(-)